MVILAEEVQMHVMEEQEIAVPGPDSAPLDSSVREAPADPFRSELLLSTRTSLADPDDPRYVRANTMEITMMADGNNAPANAGSDNDSSMDDPWNDPKDANVGDLSESPSNFDFSLNSADLERHIRNSAVQSVAFEYVYSNAYDIVYSICTWPRLLLSYCLNLFRFARKKDDDGPAPPQEDNHVQDMAIAASQSAVIGVGAGVLAGQSAAAGVGVSTMSAAISALSTPTMIGLAVAVAIAVAATTTGVATGISSGSDNNAAGPGPCAGSSGSMDVKQGVLQIVFSSSDSNSDHNSIIDAPLTSTLLLENKEELENIFVQVYNNVTANSTNGALIDQCDIPRIPSGGVQLMQVESSEEDNFTNSFWVADVQCNGCSDTDPLFGTNTEASPQLDPVRAVDDFFDQFTQAIQPILTTNDLTQETDPITSPLQQEQESPPVDILFVALVDPTTGEILPEQPQRLGPGDMIELLPNIDTVWNSNINDPEQDQLEVPQMPTPSATTAAAPIAHADRVSNPTTNPQTNSLIQQDLAPNYPGQDSVPTNPAHAAPTNAKTPEPSPTLAPASTPEQQDQTSIFPHLAPSAISSPSDATANSLPSFVIVSPSQTAAGPPSMVIPTVASGPTSPGPTNYLSRIPSINTFPPAAMSPSHSSANRDQAPSNDKQAPQPNNQKSALPPIATIKNPNPSFVIPAPPPAGSGNNGITQSIDGQPMMPSGDDSMPSSSTTKSPSQEDTTTPGVPLSEVPNNPVLVPVGGSVTSETYSAVPSTNTMPPTRDMLSPESCAAYL
ncbi:expressed unknown protein [Seminavis robusta]|uniref:Uncharacterized protein n=1 Tax=Seminavis robusta TaxID=568900 RepID=A0A9N8HDE3_9STRA|nr:expressed unknown protein [Seminavis robusta]|eukprot:Sro340_g121160.1 n/a (784) ;mRNA; f:7741-10238